MKRILVILGLVAAGTLANAQEPGIDFTNVSLRIGGAYPFEKATRNSTGTMLGIGIDLNLAKGFMPNSESYLSLDWLGKSTRGNRSNIVPILFNNRVYFNSEDEPGQRLYGFAGVGLVLVDVTVSKLVPGARAGVGKELNENLFAEANVMISGKANGASADSVGLYLGYRF